jgi:hypothetical protein
MRKPTIEEIEEATREKCPHYFDRETLKFFGQTMKSFKVSDNGDGRFKISAPSFWWKNGKKTFMGESVRYFNPATNDLEDE